MAGRKGTPPKATVFVQTPGVKDPELQRAFDVVNGAIKELQARQLASSAFDVFTASSDGLVPASGGGTSNFLRADGTWAPAPGGVSSVNAGSAAVVVSPTTGAVVVDVVPANFTGIPESGVTGLVADLAARPTGSGTAGRSARWSAATVLTDGAFTDDGTNVSLGGTLTLSTLTQGSVLFAGAGGVVTQDNAAFFWNDSTKRFGVNTNSPVSTLDVRGNENLIHIWNVRNTNANGYSAVQFDDEGGTNRLGFGYSNIIDKAYLSLDNGANLIWNGNSTLRGTFFNNGNVNFGATTADSGVKFTVEGTVRHGTLVGFTTNTPAAAVATLDVQSGRQNTGTSVGGLPDVAFQWAGAGGGFRHFISTWHDALANSASNRMRFHLNSATTAGASSTAGTNNILALELRGDGLVYVPGALQVDGNATIGNAGTDAHSLTGTLNANSTAGTNGQILQVSAGVPKWLAPSSASIPTGTGTANTMVKWTGTSTLANSLLTDNATTLSYNSGKFTVTAASGNTTVAGTLGVTGLATLTGGFTLGADSSANSHKITNLTNGSAAQDAAAFGQIGSAVNAAVSGTTGTIPYFNSANTLSDSPLKRESAAWVRQLKSAGDATFMVGDDITAAIGVQSGWKAQAYTDGNLYFDSKVYSGGTINYRYGAGAATGADAAWFTLNTATGATTVYPSGGLVVAGPLQTNSTLTVGGAAGVAIAPAGNGTASIYNDGNLHIAAESTSLHSAFISGTQTYIRTTAAAGNVAVFDATGVFVSNNLTIGAALDVNGDLSKFGTTNGDGATFIQYETVGFGYAQNANFAGWINYNGYGGGSTQYRDLKIGDGKNAEVARFTGSSKQVDFYGAITVAGNAVVTGGLSGGGGGGSFTISANGASNGNIVIAPYGATYVTGAFNVSGNVTLGDASTDTVYFGGTTGYYYVLGDSLNSYYGMNAAATSYINYYGYQSNTTQFRSTVIANGKAAAIATFNGSSKQVDFAGAITVAGDAVVTGLSTLTGGVAAQNGLSTDFIGSLSALDDLFISSRGSGNGRVYIDAEYIEIGDTFQGGAVGASGKGSLIVAGALHSYREFVAPQITADQNDYNPTDGGGIQWDASESSMLYVNSDAARNVTGLAQPAAGGTTGRHVWIYNTGSFNVTLKHQSASSSAGNRFYGPNNADVVLQPCQGRHLYNSAQMGCWIVLN